MLMTNFIWSPHLTTIDWRGERGKRRTHSQDNIISGSNRPLPPDVVGPIEENNEVIVKVGLIVVVLLLVIVIVVVDVFSTLALLMTPSPSLAGAGVGSAVIESGTGDVVLAATACWRAGSARSGCAGVVKRLFASAVARTGGAGCACDAVIASSQRADGE